MNTGKMFLPFSYLNAYAYCPRRFYYEFTLGEMEVNEQVLAGQQFHERVDRPGGTRREGALQLRRVFLCAPRLRLTGYCDVLEVSDWEDGALDLAHLARVGKLLPVEYKKGKMGKWLSDHTQVCAQALALEEVLHIPTGSIGRGSIFYIGSARRDEIPINESLRAQTLTLIQEARRVACLDDPPAPLENWRKCQDCSLEPLCLPRETLFLCKQEITVPQEEEEERSWLSSI